MPSDQIRLADQELPGDARIWLRRRCDTAGFLLRSALTRGAWPYWSVLLALMAGFALRLFFILVYPEYDGDTGVYGRVGKGCGG